MSAERFGAVDRVMLALCALDDARRFVDVGAVCPFSGRRSKYAAGLDPLCLSDFRSLDAPIFLPAGCCVDLSPFWFGYGESSQLIVRRGAV